MSSHLYTLSILGVNLTVSTTENVEYLQELEDILLTSIEDVQYSLGIQDSLSVAIMAGFFLSDRLKKKDSALDVLNKDESFLLQTQLSNIMKLLNDIT
ncbi:cell division protein ZapA [Entomospira entomophila]|uniref:Cell division protein ZapA n=1 Tax=Entomospira entomophila TaxID=2719988 RepID=A0A968KSX8_9SPIO|nr:cell division protein ZapA [Entomospira entomophilus]NIZ40832.1 cell division protein ZapA [Entomospira entomophilus]WDI35044.1 cell division protein ZapA [Entomospira entomophilus]